jgi:hypothetical protein
MASHQHVLLIIFLFLVSLCRSLDNRLTIVKPLYPGDKLISDDGGMFALGFFNLTNSTPSLYLGIWYNNIPERTYVWIAFSKASSHQHLRPGAVRLRRPHSLGDRQQCRRQQHRSAPEQGELQARTAAAQWHRRSMEEPRSPHGHRPPGLQAVDELHSSYRTARRCLEGPSRVETLPPATSPSAVTPVAGASRSSSGVVKVVISFEDLTAATNNFHETNMLGQGGFGKVYKVVYNFTLLCQLYMSYFIMFNSNADITHRGH